MTCRDCIHYDVCVIVENSANKDEDYYSEFGCNDFKNKADYVEVCRCKDCIYNEIGSCTHSQKYDEDNYRADYFCADGTPKESGGEK